MGFLGGIHLGTFLSTHGEWHSLVNGWCEVMCPWPPYRKIMSKALAEELAGEYHYYQAGRALGFVCLVLFIVGIIRVVS